MKNFYTMWNDRQMTIQECETSSFNIEESPGSSHAVSSSPSGVARAPEDDLK
jgi:hypothetical protein